MHQSSAVYVELRISVKAYISQCLYVQADRVRDEAGAYNVHLNATLQSPAKNPAKQLQGKVIDICNKV